MENVRHEIEVELARAKQRGEISNVAQESTRLLAAQKMYLRLFGLFEEPNVLGDFHIFVSYDQEIEGSDQFKAIAEAGRLMNISMNIMSDKKSLSDDLRFDTISRIASSSACLIIMTPKDHRIGNEYHGKKKMPSVWIMDEKGIAVGLNKKIAIIAHEDVDPDCLLATTASIRHFRFKAGKHFDRIEDFREKLLDALDHLRRVHAIARMKELS